MLVKAAGITLNVEHDTSPLVSELSSLPVREDGISNADEVGGLPVRKE